MQSAAWTEEIIYIKYWNYQFYPGKLNTVASFETDPSRAYYTPLQNPQIFPKFNFTLPSKDLQSSDLFL